ncbi:DNA polymerase III subunit delta [Spiroplasma gladiatoris]|uniref:DNA polymerase III subunit delta n=1 Tax=Spiroplasma gladiatoris TaxID=2143 RepID=A0A4P7AIX0_9MOLU|nr:DNA polymerase III subunit delta [Spiroplasma gladiatoris]QBQ07718.1 DNA polymerase III subunit delta [Spiroplasma gladiatoris]
MFFIYSEDLYLINKQIEKLISKINTNNDYEIYKYSLIDNSLNGIFNQINTYSLFFNKKIIIINDCWFVNETKVSLNKDYNKDIIEKIIANNNPDVEIIFTLNSDKFSKKLKITKTIESQMKVLKLEKPDYNKKIEYLTKKLNNANITFDNIALNYFIDNVDDNMYLITSEIDKLILLNKHISIDLVKNSITKSLQYNIFELAESFIKLDLNSFLKNWSNYIELNSNIIGFLSLLTSQFCVLRDSIILKNQNKDINNIASILGQNPYRIKKLMSENRINIKKINDTIKMLYILEKNFKNGQVDNKIIPELEFIKMFKREAD